MEDRILQVVRVAMSRRSLLRGSMGTAAGLAIFGSLAFREGQGLAVDLPDDASILNLALTLEHLEDRAYRDAIASGKLTGPALAAAQAYGAQESFHVQLLTPAIAGMGKTPVSEQANYNFPAFTDQATVISFLRSLEEVGVGAYTGAARYIKDKGILAVAGGIVQVEARHAASLRILDGKAPVPGLLDAVFTPDQTLAKAGPILGS